MQILVVPRSVVPTIHQNPTVLGKTWAIISISAKGDFPHVIETDECKGVLRLSFADIDRPRGDLPIFDDDHAKQILDFVAGLYESEVDYLFVHCRAGHSRSPAVAAALTKIYNGDDHCFFRRFRPNMRVYSTILKVHHSEEM